MPYKILETELSERVKQRAVDLYDDLYHIALKRAGSEEANDASQEIMLKIFKVSDSYDPSKGDLSHWIRRVAKNTALNYVQSRSRKKDYTMTDEELDWIVNERAQSPLDILEQSENKHLLSRAVKDLSSSEKELCRMYYNEGYSLELISLFSDCTIASAKSRLHRIREKLRTELGDLVYS